jgi:hypothetical protein
VAERLLDELKVGAVLAEPQPVLSRIGRPFA